MNLVAIQGLGATPMVGETTTCMDNAQYQALVESNTQATTALGEAEAQRWAFLVGGFVLGAVFATAFWRSQ